MYITQQEVEKFIKLVSSYETIIIHRHQRPDPDALGSQLGLKHLLSKAFPQKRVLAAGSKSRGLEWLGAMDKVSKEDYAQALVIICDTANEERIDGKYYSLGQKIIKIDHHPLVEDFGDLQIIYPQASSTSEIIGQLAQAKSELLPMDAQIARLLYAGIVGDTGRFMFRSTSADTFKIAAWLSQYDFDRYDINNQFQLLSYQQAKFEGYFFDHLQINDSGVAWLSIPIALRQQYGLTEEDTNLFVNLPSRIRDVQTWVIFVEQDTQPSYWRCRIRSKGSSINQIASLHEGGGHPLASGANVYSEEEKMILIQELSQVSLADSKA
ncbi:DHH family phosphoesterase [Ignavigranum ruoffiae]|uniref:Phosphoesterase RecJ domain-containing protein n=1 Tax=Ignavigranum ruoffiae TaxID=89093 RepID=A0A1H8ZSW0_9LACT|nr:bifunctional oligoribonuclease/PAP phosphatase NrnA [Ignavigranum ruoffiae]UPQ85646.1 bifunctional oligoribonuclease/PAP phosphatase NrnA [Ignavigranum ruoffiae]SEP67570.1 phosphoesterase RecJ domain-containing protein [Ignavigranum ruoffiae]